MFPSHLSHKYKNPFAAHVPTPFLLLPLRSGSRACVWVLGLGLFRLFCHRGCELSDASQPTPRVGPWSWPGQPTSVNFNEVSNGSSSFATHPLPAPHSLPPPRIVAVMIFLLPFLFVSVSVTVTVAITVFLLPTAAVRGFHTAFAAWSGF